MCIRDSFLCGHAIKVPIVTADVYLEAIPLYNRTCRRSCSHRYFESLFACPLAFTLANLCRYLISQALILSHSRSRCKAADENILLPQDKTANFHHLRLVTR